jgi:acyl-coenzyme A synthetase/AMP-(fatty) acid ligase
MISLQTLRQACLAGGSYPVAQVAGHFHTADQLRQQALALAATLAAHPEQRWALWLASPYEFLTAFLALELSGKDIVLPGNMQQGTARLLAPHFDGLISHQLFQELGCLHLEPQGHMPVDNFTPHATRDTEVTLFTSGSTGEPQAIAKRLGLLEAELQMQQRQWHTAVARLPVLATVSHQHIYGLLHAVLWPFLRKAPFVDEICQYPEELAARAEPLAPVVLVSSPTHLARLPQVPVFAGGCDYFSGIFSSGGLLDTESALALSKLLGRAPIEILGSTETGGVAWRQQQRQESTQRWAPLPGVEVDCDAGTGRLTVSAHHLNAEQLMGDRVTVHGDGTFVLQGRADRIVKVEGKRLSVTEMERHLQASELISDARIAVVCGKREEVGAVIVLSEAGRQTLARLGKLPLNKQLGSELLAWFERPLLPRRWRYVAELPCNSQGKVTAGELERILKREV